MKRIALSSIIGTLGLICFGIIFLSGDDCPECFSAPVMAVKFLICGLVIIIWTIYSTKEFLKTEKIIFDIESLPLLETDEAVAGVPFAGQGIIEPEGEKILKSPYTNTPCVYFHSIKEVFVKKEKGGHWEIIENIAYFVPFYIKDERGKLKIDITNFDDDFSGYSIPIKREGVANPKNSEIDCDAIVRCQPWHQIIEPPKRNFFFSIFPQSDSEHRKYRISEFVLKPGTKVFVHGMVSKRNNELVLHEAEGYPLIISKKNRDQYVQEFYRGENLIYLSHFLVAIGFNAVLLSINYFLKINTIELLTLLFFGNAIILGSAIFFIYNRIITLKNRALNSLSNIKIELKRRADLIPNIIEVAKVFTKDESEIQKIIAEGRAEIYFSKELKKEDKPVISSLAAIIENYPDLKSSENLQSLMRILVDTEERIAYCCEFYNRSVRKYNTLIRQIPFLFISLLLKLKEMDFVRISRGKEIIPEISI